MAQSALHEALMADMSEPAEEAIEETVEAVDDIAEEPEEADTTEVSEPEEDQAEVETEETAEAEETEALDVSELSQYLGIDADKLDTTESGELLIKAKIDGKETTATLQDLISSYQIKGHLNNQNMEVVELKKALTEKQSTLDSTYEAKFKEAEDLAAIAMGVLNQDFNSIDWKDLEVNDREEFLFQKTKFNERQAQIAQAYQKIQADKPKPVTGPSPEQLQEEHSKLLAAIPTWSDQAVAAKEWSEMASYATNQGFTFEELNNINDHRVMVALRKSMMFDNLQKESPAITKRVKKAPKIAKPGTGVVKDQSSDKLKKLRARAISGEKGAFAQYLLQTGNVK